MDFYILCIILIAELAIHHFERRDLYNRIMSKDMKEYRKPKTKPQKLKSAHKAALDRWREVGE